MAKLLNNRLEIENESDFYLIAEIGHNHQGSLSTAKDMFVKAKESGASAVKLQKRDNKNLYTKNLYNQVYDNENSFGSTYGEHREKLEFDKDSFLELADFAKKIDIDFFSTAFDFNSVDFLEDINIQAYKIASGDLLNTPLQKYIAKKQKQIFLSTGGGNFEDINRAVKNILEYNDNLVIFHCTASYPANHKDMNLRIITELKKQYPDLVIGLSDHENGIQAADISYMLGARVFEKHFTLNRANKGTDNAFSLEPIGLKKLFRNLSRIEAMLGDNQKKLLDSEKKAINKMGKSIVAAKQLEKNHIINEEDIKFKSPADGLHPYEVNKLIGKKLNKKIITDELIKLEDINED